MARRPPTPKKRPLSLAAAAPRAAAPKGIAPTPRTMQGDDIYVIGFFVLILLATIAAVHAFVVM